MIRVTCDACNSMKRYSATVLSRLQSEHRGRLAHASRLPKHRLMDAESYTTPNLHTKPEASNFTCFIPTPRRHALGSAGASPPGALPRLGPALVYGDLRVPALQRIAEMWGLGALRMSAGLACSRPRSLSLYWYSVFVKPGVSVYEMLLSRPYRFLPHDIVGTWRSEFGSVHACL